MVRFDGYLIAVLVGLAALALPAAAQPRTGSSSLTHVVSVTIAARVKVHVSPLSMVPRNVPTAVKVAVSQGATSGLTLIVRANQAWVLAIKSANADTPRRSKLLWSNSAAGRFTAISAAGSLLASGTGSADSVDTTVVFRDAAKSASNTAGQAVVLTVSAP